MNPYETPPQEIQTRPRIQWGRHLLQLACLCGLFCNFWYAGTVALYLLVYGDNSSMFGFYSVFFAAVLSIGLTVRFRNRPKVLALLVLLTLPITLLFAANLIRFGV